jgi:hypothetical protein
MLMGGLVLAAAAAPAPAQAPADFEAAAGRFAGCMVATVRMGMTTKMDPAAFEAGFARSCKAEEAAFRAAAVKQAIALGRTEAEAAAEVDGNIAYVRTGKVPR